MSLFATMPNLNLGKTNPPNDLVERFLTPRDILRLEAALDCFALTLIKTEDLGHITHMSLRVIGHMPGSHGHPLPISVLVGYWPGFDHQRVVSETTHLTQLLRTLEPQLSTNALKVSPKTRGNQQKMEQSVVARAILDRQYQLPFPVSAHKIVAAKSWVESLIPNISPEESLSVS